MSDDLRLVLVRVLDNGTWAEVGYTLAHQAIRRPVTFRVNRDGTPGEEMLDGLALIGENDETPASSRSRPRPARSARSREDRADHRAPVATRAAHAEPLACGRSSVPLVAWFRSRFTDEDILRLAGVDRATGEPSTRPPGVRWLGLHGVAGSAAAGSIPIPCTACMGSGQAADGPRMSAEEVYMPLPPRRTAHQPPR
jgi:hypothetical protein